MQNNERLTTGITTLHYCMSWMSLHAAHDTGFKERGTNVIAANVRRHRFAKPLKGNMMKFFLFLLIPFNAVLAGGVPNLHARVDTTLVQLADVTGDGRPDTIFLHMRGNDFLSPFVWSLSVKINGKKEVLYTQKDSGAEYSFTDLCNTNYVDCKYTFFFRDFAEFQLIKDYHGPIEHGKDMLFDKTYEGSIYHMAKDYLVDYYHLSPAAALAAIDKMVTKLRHKQALVITYSDGDLTDIEPLMFCPEVNAFIPIYSC